MTLNDAATATPEPNDLQNYPRAAARPERRVTRVAGSINSTPNTSILLDFFADSSLDESGFGEGERWLDSKYVTTDGAGNASFDFLLDAATVVGEWITATATGETSSTSEFSAGMSTEAATFQVVTNTSDAGPGSLRDVIEAVNQLAGADPVDIFFHIPDTDPNFLDADSDLAGGDTNPDVFVISPLSALPAITRGNVILDGQSQQGITGDSNPFGPEIVLAGNLAGASANGLVLASSATSSTG